MLDREIRREQVQDIRNVDGLVALFAELGYRTDLRAIQTTEALAITPESAASQIKKIERIADQESLLQIFLFEVTSLTQALTQSILRAFKNRAGQYLLVLTDDYDRLDFVLIERRLPLGKGEGLIPKQVSLRPRTVSIERQNPTRVHLRLLRRLTYTESDPQYQFEKLRSAFEMAEWSEEFFNNRGLFSDYFLNERVPDTDQWKEDPKPTFRRLTELLAKANERWGKKPKTDFVEGLVRPILLAMGFSLGTPRKTASGDLSPDFLLSVPSSSEAPVALCLIYPWGRWLDGKDDQRDADTPDDNPGARIVSLLEQEQASWAILTNGKLWRLYSSKAHSRSTNYYEIDLEETIAYPGPQGHDAAEAFRYFWIIFRAKAFDSHPSFLDDILAGSEAYARKLGDRLKERIFEEIFPIFAEGFIAHIRRRDGKRADLSQPALDHIFQGTLTILYRLLFILYAESRNLLPVKEYHGYGQKSLKLIKEEVADKGADLEGARDEKLGTACSATEDSLYRRLMALCAVIDKGDRALNVPMYNGGLFMAEPPEDDTSLEAGNARFLRDHIIPDRWLARGLDRMARDVDDKSHALVFIDYKSLGVRHLGSIYEGLLEFKLRVAAEKMAFVEGKKAEEIIPYREAQQEKRKILKTGRGKDAVERLLAPGTVYLENDRRERKATGSYYTPDYIVQYIVEHAVGPVLEDKFATISSKLREAQKTLRQEREKAKVLGKMFGKHDDPEHEAYLKHQHVVDELFDVKVLDPAMGSGHFLVEAVDFTTDRLLHFLNGFPWNPVLAHLKETREIILAEMERQGISIDAGRLSDVNLLKRHVLKRCIYGVDLNPMAVELAKVSLWLDCFTLGAPLSFLDHHLKCGNSLIGASVEEVRETIEKGQLSLLSGRHFETLMLATDLMQHVGELSDVTAEQVRESQREYRKAKHTLAPFQRLLDVYTSRWFGNESRVMGKGKTGREVNIACEFLRAKDSETWAHTPETPVLPGEWKQVTETATQAAEDKRFFHWELEYPEAFFERRRGTTQIERKANAGFDAVVGNPPYERVQVLRQSDPATADFLGLRYQSAVKNFDIYLPFFELGLRLTKSEVCYIAPNKWFATDYGAGLRKLVVERQALARVVDFRDHQLFEDATNYVCILSLSRNPRSSFVYVDGSSGEIGAEQMLSQQGLAVGGEVWSFASGAEGDLLKRLLEGGCPRLKALRDRAFQGLRTSDNDVYVLQAVGAVRKGMISVASRATGGTHDIETAILKPLLSGEEIRAFSITHSEQWVLFPYDLSSERATLLSEKTLRSDFPGAWKYLKACENRLRARERGKMDGPGWWAYIYPKNLDQFEQPKVMLPDYNDHPAAALDLKGGYYSITAYCLTLRGDSPISLPILTCLLNSNLLFWILGKTGTALQRGFVRFMPQYLDKLPIAIPDKERHRTLERIAQRAMKEGYEAVKEDLNREVYRLYGLTDEEITIVEEKP